MIVVVSGSPGTGKTTLASRLSRRYRLAYLNVGEIILENGAWSEYDPVHRSFIIEPILAARYVGAFVRENPRCVIETTDLWLLFEAGIEPLIVIVLRVHPGVLYKRLLAKSWPREKIIENLEAELVGVIYSEAVSLYGVKRVCSLDTTALSPGEVETVASNAIEDAARGEAPSVCHDVDWLADSSAVELVSALASSAGI